MENLILIIWYASLAVITGYYLFIFRIRKPLPAARKWEHPPGISVVIPVRNDSDRIIRNLQELTKQQYPLYEIIVVDDHSNEDERRKLQEAIFHMTNVFLFHSDAKQGKKHALDLGVNKANYHVILCTDADCVPADEHWLHCMICHSDGTDVMLGYSPYKAQSTALNQLVRFETVMTAIQYMSWGLLRRPYMAVGRNMLFAKSLYQQYGHSNPVTVPYGHDDFFLHAIRGKVPVHICVEKSSFVHSEAPSTWKEWMNQKHRHLSAAHHYPMSNWWQPGLFGMAMIFHWFLFLPVLLCCANAWLLFLFAAAMAFRWFGFVRWSGKLGETDLHAAYPFFEILYSVYLAVMGIYTLFNKKRGWT